MARPLARDSYLADELHVTVLDTVVDHLDVVAGTLVSDPLAASLAIALSGDALEDVLDVRPRALVTSGHYGRAVSGTFLATGDTGAHEAQALGLKVLGSAIRVGEVRVSTVDDDVTAVEEGQQSLDPVVNGLAGLDKKHDAARLLQLGDELLGRVCAHDGLALGLVGNEAVDLGDCTVESADGEAVVGHVQDQVLAHDGQADEAEVSASNIVSIGLFV